MLSDNTNFFPTVETFKGQEPPKPDIPQEEVKPKKRGALAKGRTKKKQLPLSRDHFKSTSEAISVSREKMKRLEVGQLPQVAVQPATVQQQQEIEPDGAKVTGLTLPDILLKHSNLWGKRNRQKKEENVHLEVAGTDLKLPPPRPMSISRKNKLAQTKMTYASEHAMFREVEDIKQILHCHIVGMPVEMKKTAEDSKQVARPIFHCQSCHNFWKNTGEIRTGCNRDYKPVKGPVILLSAGAAALIKSVWTRREESPKTQQHEKSILINEFTKGENEHVEWHEEENDENIIDELGDYDDCSVVLEHIAEGIARDAGFEQHIMRTATREIAENLALIIYGRKPDDIAMMELIEKYIRETDLMVLRGMIESNNVDDMKILKEKMEYDNTYVVNQREKATKLLDRLAVLKARDTNSFRKEKIVYLTELFNVKCGEVKQVDQVPTVMGERDVHENIFTNIKQNSYGTVTDRDMKPRRTAGVNYGHQKLVKNFNYQSKPEACEDIEIDSTPVIEESLRIDHKGIHKEDVGVLESTKSKTSIVSSSSASVYQGSKSSTSTLPVTRSKHVKGHFAKGRDTKEVSSKQTAHKTLKPKTKEKHKKSKQKPQKEKMQEKTNNFTINDDLHTASRNKPSGIVVEHVVYDIDDEDDNEEEDEQEIDAETFLIPGNDGYSDSTYNYLVDEFVAHYEQMSVDESGRPLNINIDTLRQQMDRGNVRKTGLSRKPVARSESEEEIVRLFEAASTVNVEQLLVPSIGNVQYSSDIVYSINSNNIQNSTVHRDVQKPLRKHKKKVKNDQPKRVTRNPKFIERSMSGQLDSDSSEIFEEDNPTSNIGPPLKTSTEPHVDSVKKPFNQPSMDKVKTKPSSDGNSLMPNTSFQTNSSNAKHMSVAETHFGMQLDALANLPTAPNATDYQAKRKKSLGPTSRPKVMPSINKEATKAYHSKQIENANFSGATHTPDKELLTETATSKSDVQDVNTESKQKESKKIPIKFGMSRKTVTNRRSRGEAMVHSVTSSTSRPGSSKFPLPPIHKAVYDNDIADDDSPDMYEQEICPTVMEKPIAIVKPMTKTLIGAPPTTTGQITQAENIEIQETPTTEAYSTSSTLNIAEEQPHERPKIYIPDNEISILSFTPSFSFSLFTLPNQYRKQNDDVKNAVGKVGRTQAKEPTQELLAKIPVRDKNRNKGQSKTNKVVHGLNKRVLRKVTDPKPIARYVKKLDMVKEELPSDTEVTTKKEQNEKLKRSKQLLRNSSRNVAVESRECVTPIKSYLGPSHHNDKIAFASVPMESQMHLANTESILIKVQEYV